MVDLHHWYAWLHGPRAVRVIQTALTDEADRRADAARSAEADTVDSAEPGYGTCTVSPSPSGR